MRNEVISLRLDDTQKQRLDSLAARTGRSRTYYIKQAINDQLDRLEYIYKLEQEAMAAWRGEIDTISLEDLEAECDLAD